MLLSDSFSVFPPRQMGAFDSNNEPCKLIRYVAGLDGNFLVELEVNQIGGNMKMTTPLTSSFKEKSTVDD